MNVNNRQIIRNQAKRRARIGMAFIATMIVLFLVLCTLLLGSLVGGRSTGSGLQDESSDAAFLANHSLNETAAFNLAESGIEYTMEWLHEQAAPPTNTTAFLPNWAGSPTQWGGTAVNGREQITMAVDASAGTTGTFSVVIYPDLTSTGTQHKYVIDSIGAYNGVTQTVEAYVAQGSFGGYAYFTDMEQSNGYWDTQLNSFDGPMHSNNSNTPGTPGQIETNIIWHNSTASPPMFTYNGSNAFSCCASAINWNLNSIGNYTSPSSTSDWTHVAAGGSTTVSTGAPDVPLPSSSALQQSAALGGTSAPVGTAPSVTIPSGGGGTIGGVYIHGPVSEMAFSVTNSVVQNITITQTNSTTNPVTTDVTTVTIDPTTGTNGTTTVSVAATQGGNTTTTATSYSGTTNGVVYADSSIGTQSASPYTSSVQAWDSGDYYYGNDKTGGVHGVIADNDYNSNGSLVHDSAITLATSSTANLNFDGSLTTNTQRATSAGAYVPESQDSNYVTKAGTLGIITDTAEVVDNDYNGVGINNFELDGSILAYNTFDCTNIYGRPTGKFQLMGGYIAEQGGFFGVIDYSGNLLTGFAEHYNYDDRLADSPPPFFPTTGTNYDIVSWQRVSTPFSG